MCSAERPARASSVAAIGVAVLLFPRSARSEVRVERGEGAGACPEGAAFATRMRADDDGRPPITVRFERTPKAYRSVVVTAETKQRTLADDGSSCDGLAEANPVDREPLADHRDDRAELDEHRDGTCDRSLAAAEDGACQERTSLLLGGGEAARGACETEGLEASAQRGKHRAAEMHPPAAFDAAAAEDRDVDLARADVVRQRGEDRPSDAERDPSRAERERGAAPKARRERGADTDCEQTAREQHAADGCGRSRGDALAGIPGNRGRDGGMA